MAVKIVFSILAFLFMAYAILCTIKIILTWIPGTNNGFTKFLAAICDPYLNLISKTKLLRFGQLDFSPIIALGILSILSTVFSGIATDGKIGIGKLLGTTLQMSMYTATSVLNFFILFLGIRFIILIIEKTQSSSSPFWSQFDYFVSPVVYKISRFFSGGKMLSYRSTLLISIFFFVAISIITYLLISRLVLLTGFIPF